MQKVLRGVVFHRLMEEMVKVAWVEGGALEKSTAGTCPGGEQKVDIVFRKPAPTFLTKNENRTPFS